MKKLSVGDTFNKMRTSVSPSTKAPSESQPLVAATGSLNSEDAAPSCDQHRPDVTTFREKATPATEDTHVPVKAEVKTVEPVPFDGGDLCAQMRWMILPVLYNWVILAVVLAISYALGHNHESAGSNIFVGLMTELCAIVCFVVLMPFYYQCFHTAEKLPTFVTRRFADVVSCVGCAVISASILGAPLVGLLEARLHMLHELNGMGTLNLVCNTNAEKCTRSAAQNAMPSQVHVADPSKFELLDRNIHFLADGNISFILVAAKSPSMCNDCAQGNTATNSAVAALVAKHNSTGNNSNSFLRGLTVMALSVPKHFEPQHYKWPPKVGPAFFRAPTKQPYFSKDPNGFHDRWWYKESPLWKKWGVPLVTKDHYDDLAQVERDYERYMSWVLGVCAVIMFLPFLRLGVKNHRQYWYPTAAVLAHLGPILMIIFGAVCLARSEDWMMISMAGSIGLILLGLPSFCIVACLWQFCLKEKMEDDRLPYIFA